jgi:demethylmenaquinone methyltransferase/2-methoxy-6-polyprenyl-1,4-benzoquinol methylase
MVGVSVQNRIREEIRAPVSKRRYVRSLFDRVARRYDLTNDIMSLGRHRRWKQMALELADIGPGHVVLDLAAGTGDFALRAAAIGAGSKVIAADFATLMLEVGRRRKGADRIGWIQCDATYLPFQDRSVDRVLIGYGLRNFPDLGLCLAEIRRCLRPGGRFVTLDFGRAEPPWLDRLYLRYLEVSTTVAGWLLHRDVESYRYIPESLRSYPAQKGVTDLMQRLGFVRCGHIDLVFGAMAINFGEVPA